MPRPIITNEDILRIPNASVTSDEIDELIRELEESLHLQSGVGLAAPQIGINKRAAIIRINTNSLQCSLNLINPIIEDKLYPFVMKDEGCLSFPGESFNTQRYNEIFIKDDLHPAGMIITSFEAVVVYHEIDHIENILVKDRQIGKNKIGRNDPCPCGKTTNGKKIKFKKCHGG